MGKYDGIKDETFVRLIEKDFKELEEKTSGHISLMYHNTPKGDGSDRRWHVKHSGSSTVLDNYEAAGFTVGAMAALIAHEETQP